jgi:uncharacterized protein with FMN-binding domain
VSSTSKKPGSGRMSNGLVALGSAAVFAVYATGFLKTKTAAEEFDEPVGPRRATVPPGDPASSAAGPEVAPAAGSADTPSAPSRIETPSAAPSVALALPTTPANRTQPAAATAAAATTATPAVPPASVDAPAAVLAPAAPASSASPAVAAAQSLPASAAVTSAAVAVAATAVPSAKYKDGTYTGWGSCRHGDIQAQVVVADGRITNASVMQCLTRWSCSWISPLPPQVPQRQSAEVDYVSGATQSAIAFYNALVDAIAKAKP